MDADSEYAMIDETKVLADEHSAGAKKTSDEDFDQAIRRSKGRLSTKIHATCDALGNPIGFHLNHGQAHDLIGSDVLLNDHKLGHC